jgi:hypothetical protein
MHRTGSSPASHTTTRQTESFFPFLWAKRAATWRDLQEEGVQGQGVQGEGVDVRAFVGVSVRWTLRSNRTYETYRTYVIASDAPIFWTLEYSVSPEKGANRRDPVGRQRQSCHAPDEVRRLLAAW